MDVVPPESIRLLAAEAGLNEKAAFDIVYEDQSRPDNSFTWRGFVITGTHSLISKKCQDFSIRETIDLEGGAFDWMLRLSPADTDKTFANGKEWREKRPNQMVQLS